MKETWMKDTTTSRPGAKKCSVCHKVFVKDEVFAVLERQDNWFRGDDEVYFYCAACLPPGKRRELKINLGGEL